MNNFKTKSETEITKINRIDVHSHIKGLGLNNQLEPKKISEGMVGQLSARKALSIVSKIVKNSKISGRGILLSGPPGTGKTALAIALANSLGEDTPFTSLSAPEIYSLEMSKTETLTQSLRKSIGVYITEETEIIEGEVVEIIIDRSVDPSSAVRLGKITLKTTEMESIYDCGQKMVDAISKQRLEAGDVINIDKSSGKISRLGRSFSRAQDFDAMGSDTRFVSCPQGDLQKRKEINHKISLHEIDVINSRSQGFLALFSGDTGEISSEIRSQIDKKIHCWTEENKAKISPGVLFIDEAHVLDEECFSFLGRALEQDLCPLIVLATNRGFCNVKGTEVKSAHGIPSDLLDRLLIIPTFDYNKEETAGILKKRCKEESLNIAEEAFILLVKISVETSLRYSMNLLVSSNLLCQQRNGMKISVEDIKRGFDLFSDVGRSSRGLTEGMIIN